jgi:lysophospholipid acyltransferase (LPLAT)-like uncharacterized protein
LIPRPFSRGCYLFGEPLTIPANLSRDQVELYTARVQAEMDRLERKLARIVGGEELPETYRRAA